MGKYFYETDGISRDELSGGGDGIPQETWNVNVGASAAIERGMLLCADSPTDEFSLVATADDAQKVLAIAREDFTADAEHTVTQAFVSGKFNREKIILGGDSSLTIDAFENELRKQNLHLTALKEMF